LIILFNLFSTIIYVLSIEEAGDGCYTPHKIE